ncbi:MAG: DUF4150 domain-containing protein [Methylococcales bacterium]|nr:DUF4150 domain-containing protein [Methylococcales bacterium]
MSNEVYANGREMACKAGSGKTIAAFPDVCFTPPENPATPPGVPVPYPNTGSASDTTEGSKTVMISGKEIMLKHISYFKTLIGDEAGCAAKKGVITSTNKGKVYFEAWSMDVKFEGENIDRHMDLTTTNHASDPGDAPPWTFIDSMAMAPEDHPCKTEINEAQSACKDAVTTGSGKTATRDCSSSQGNCKEKMACILVPKGNDKEMCCAPGNTGHHMIEDHWVKGNNAFPMAQGSSGYDAAPTVCVEGGRYEKEHGEMHIAQGLKEESFLPGGENAGQAWNYGEGKSAALMAHEMTFGSSGCSRTCMESQLDNFYGEDDSRPLNPPKTQALAKNDPGDGRWLRTDANVSLQGQLTSVLG